MSDKDEDRWQNLERAAWAGHLSGHDCREILEEIQSGRLSDDDLMSAMHVLGHARHLEAADMVATYLGADDASMRMTATHVLGLELRARQYKGRLIDILREDPHQWVRWEAAWGLGTMLSDSRDEEASRALAAVVKGIGEGDMGIREAAYGALLTIHGKHEEFREMFPLSFDVEPLTDEAFLARSDWGFVDRCFGQEKDSGPNA